MGHDAGAHLAEMERLVLLLRQQREGMMEPDNRRFLERLMQLTMARVTDIGSGMHGGESLTEA